MRMEPILGFAMGIGLSAACGFRIFVPLLIISVAARTGHVALAHSFAWMASDLALITLLTATVLEIAAYYLPWVDNLLDSVTTPGAVVAGTIAAGSMFTDMDPFLKWTLAVIAGGGIAGLVQAGTVFLRGASTLATGGTANHAVATAEAGGATAASLLALFLPIAIPVVLLAALALYVRQRRRAGRRAT
jgi:hypothetical protein